MKKEMNPPCFNAFGLNICCSLPGTDRFGLRSAQFPAPNVSIHHGIVPPVLADAYYQTPQFSLSAEAFLMNIPGVARYLVQGGAEITVEKEFIALDSDVLTYALGTAMGVLLLQRGVLPFHGSAVRTPQGAVMFCGTQGAGKSTTAAALCQLGWEFMSDDVCAVYFSDGCPILFPGLSGAKLAADSFTYVNGGAPASSPVAPILQKYGFSFSSSCDPAPLTAICILEPSDDALSIRPLTGAARLTAVIAQLYRPLFHEFLQVPPQRFACYTGISRHASVYQVSRPVDFSRMSAFLSLLQSCGLLSPRDAASSR